MRKDRLYFYTFLSITVIFIIISSIVIPYLVKASANQLIETQLESSKREAKEIASMIAYQLQDTIYITPKEVIIKNLQKSIEETNLETGFISMVNWSGVQISHPDKKKIGFKIKEEESLVSSIDDNINPEDFYKILLESQDANNSIDPNSTDIISKAIFSYPIDYSDSDWLVNAHINVTKTLSQVRNIRSRFYIIFIIMGFIVILASVITVRIIGSLYEKQLENENKKLEEEVISLAKLNKAIDRFQQKAIEEKQEQKTEIPTPTPKAIPSPEENNENPKKKEKEGKKRILTYLRNEILTVNIEDIAYIFTENTITYVVNKNGKRSTVSTSLDELQSNLDPNLFYRANRQSIISIIAIEKIIRYGNSQLKILMTPASETDIIIGKNKAAEFKQWLNL